MHLKLILSAVLLFSLSSCTIAKEAAQPEKKKWVFLFAGQSNMDGRANAAQLSVEDQERLKKVANRIAFHYNGKAESPLQASELEEWHKKKFQLEKCFGPELFFGIELAEKYPEQEFIFIKRAQGGTSLYGAWNSEWTAEKAALVDESNQPKLYSELIAYAQEILTNQPADSYELKAMLWVQGEDDSNVKKWGSEPADTYGANLQNLIAAFRNDLKQPELPFMIFQVGNGNVVKGMKTATKNDQNVYLIPQARNRKSPDFYEKNPPPIGHYTAQSMKKIGKAFFRVFESFGQSKDQ